MNISGISANGAVNAALAQQQASIHQEVGVTMLKKAMDIQTQGALALIEAIPTPSGRQGLPDNLGNTINTTA